MSGTKITTLKQLYSNLDLLFKDIFRYCENCREEDCKGYIWLLPEEIKRFINRRIPIVEINKTVHFLDSFVRRNKKIDVEFIKPSCVYRNEDRRCALYSLRPLVCRFYPLDLMMLGDEIWLIIHTDCLFFQKLDKSGKLNNFLVQVKGIFYNCSKLLLKYLSIEYKKVYNILKYPSDYRHDDYIQIIKLNNKNMSKCKAVLDSKKIREIKVKVKKHKKVKK